MEQTEPIDCCAYCKSTENVTFTSDPFQSEINGDDTEMFICAECYHDSLMDI